MRTRLGMQSCQSRRSSNAASRATVCDAMQHSFGSADFWCRFTLQVSLFDFCNNMPTRTRMKEATTMSEATLGGRFTFPGTSLTVQRIGYGAMQLAGPGVWGPPKDPDGAVAVLREAVAAGVNHIDTSDFYGPHITNQIIRQALHPYPTGMVIVTKLGARRPADKS